MQIHELNTFQGDPGENDFLAIDNGTDTAKIPSSKLGVTTKMTQAEAEAGTSTEPRVVTPKVFRDAVESIASSLEVLVLTRSSFSSLPITITNSNITSDMVCIKAELGTPSAQTADWEVNTSDGSLTVGPSGAISGSTTLKLYLAKSR